MDYCETSVMDIISIEKIFDRMTKLVIKKKTELQIDTPTEKILLGRKDTQKLNKKKNCCKGS